MGKGKGKGAAMGVDRQVKVAQRNFDGVGILLFYDKSISKSNCPSRSSTNSIS